MHLSALRGKNQIQALLRTHKSHVYIFIIFLLVMKKDFQSAEDFPRRVVSAVHGLLPWLNVLEPVCGHWTNSLPAVPPAVCLPASVKSVAVAVSDDDTYRITISMIKADPA